MDGTWAGVSACRVLGVLDLLPVYWYVGLGPGSSGGQGYVQRWLQTQGSWGNLSAGRWGCVSVQLTAWPEASQYLCLQTVGLQWDFSVVISCKKNSRIVLPCCRRSSPKWFRNLCPQGEMELFPTSPGGVGLTQATTKLLLLPWVDFVWVPYKWGLYFHQPSRTPRSLWPSKPNSPEGGVSSQCWISGLWSPKWDSDLSILWENLCSCDCSPVCGSLTWGYGIWLYHYSAPPAVSLWFLLYILIVDLFW